MRKVDRVKHEEKRREILLAAERCFLRDGFRGASISDICAEANVSPGHLYHYFESKELIIAMMTELDLERISERFGRMAETPNIVTALLSEFDQRLKSKPRARKPALILEVSAEASRNPAIAELLEEWHRRIREMLGELIREGQERGLIDSKVESGSAAVVVFSVLVSAMGTADMESPRAQAKVNAMRKMMISRFLAPQNGRPIL